MVGGGKTVPCGGVFGTFWILLSAEYSHGLKKLVRPGMMDDLALLPLLSSIKGERSPASHPIPSLVLIQGDADVAMSLGERWRPAFSLS